MVLYQAFSLFSSHQRGVEDTRTIIMQRNSSDGMGLPHPPHRRITILLSHGMGDWKDRKEGECHSRKNVKLSGMNSLKGKRNGVAPV